MARWNNIVRDHALSCGYEGVIVFVFAGDVPIFISIKVLREGYLTSPPNCQLVNGCNIVYDLSQV